LNAGVVALQLLLGEGVDRGTGLLGNERASNTIGLFLMLVALGFWISAGRFFSSGLIAFVSAVMLSWLGDGKASLALVLIFLLVFAAGLVLSAVSGAPRLRLLSKIVVALAVTGIGTMLAFNGVFTGSSANLRTEVREGVVSTYTNWPVVSSDLESEVPIDTERRDLWGDGLGSGASYLGHLLTQGHLNLLPDSAVLSQQSAATVDARGLETGSTGLFYSPYRTALGILDEIGVLGLILYTLMTVVALLQFRRTVSGAGLLAVFSLILTAVVVTPFLEYPEVSLSVAVFLVLLSGKSEVQELPIPQGS